MKTKILPLIMTLSLISSIGFASPLMDYSKGKTAVEIDWLPRQSMKDVYTGYIHDSVDRKSKDSTYAFALTTGLGGK